MFVHAELLAGVKENAILAPQQGVTRNQRGEPTAMVVGADNKVELRVLKADRTTGNTWLVEDGLKEGDRLITEGLQFVQPGAEVKAVPARNVKAGEVAQDAAKNNGKG